MANNFRAWNESPRQTLSWEASFLSGFYTRTNKREGDDSRCGSTSYEREKGRADLSKEYNFRKWNLVPEIWLLFLLE
jgi:hypothetical protein